MNMNLIKKGSEFLKIQNQMGKRLLIKKNTSMISMNTPKCVLIGLNVSLGLILEPIGMVIQLRKELY